MKRKKTLIMLIMVIMLISIGLSSITVTKARAYSVMVIQNETNWGDTLSNALTIKDIYEASPHLLFVQPWNSSMDGDVWTESATGTDSYSTAPTAPWQWEGNNVSCSTDTVDKARGNASVKCVVNGTNPWIQVRLTPAGTLRDTEAVSIMINRFLNTSFKTNGTGVNLTNIGIYGSYYVTGTNIPQSMETNYMGLRNYSASFSLSSSWNTYSFDLYNKSVLKGVYGYYSGVWDSSKSYYWHFYLGGVRFYFTGLSTGDAVWIDDLGFWVNVEVQKPEGYDNTYYFTAPINIKAYVKDENVDIFMTGINNVIRNFQLGEYNQTVDATKNGGTIGFIGNSGSLYYQRIYAGMYDSSFYGVTLKNYVIFNDSVQLPLGYFIVYDNNNLIDVTIEHARGERAALNVYGSNNTFKRLVGKNQKGESYYYSETITNVTFDGVTYYDTESSGIRGVSLHHGDNITIKNLKAVRPTYNPIYTRYGPLTAYIVNYTFENNYKSFNEENGTYLGWSGGTILTYSLYNEIYWYQDPVFVVVDEQGNLLQGAKITLTNSLGETVTMTTDSNGRADEELFMARVWNAVDCEANLTEDAAEGSTIILVDDNSCFTPGMTISLVNSNGSAYSLGSYRYFATTVNSTGSNSTDEWIVINDAVSSPSYWKVSWGAMARQRPSYRDAILHYPYNVTIEKEGYVPVKIINYVPQAEEKKIIMHGTRSLYPINARIISGTTYSAGDTLDVEVEVLDAYGQPVNNATCYFTIYYPDKTTWLTSITTTYLNYGVYYNNSYTVPSTTGVYTYSAKCDYGAYSAYASKYFQVR